MTNKMETALLTKNPLEDTLRKRFGFAAFRPGQREAIETLMQEKRLLCIQPTGHGKSLLYQLPSLYIDGLTLVISPLLALMRDQLHHLSTRFHIPAASINTDQSGEENEQARKMAVDGQLRILFIAPEKLDNLEVYEFLLSLNVGLLVVDEAHCISTWGHDFRPSYRQIIRTVRALEKKRPDLLVLGITATANHQTETDIARQLQDPQGTPLTILRTSMDRPNINLSVSPVTGLAQKLDSLQTILSRLPGSGILYCATREQTEIVAGFLQGQGLEVASYHAGYDSQQKRALQHHFMTGTYKAIAATNALGMGIDKSDIRFIIHVDVPGSITAYYQEVGRAGRDGLPAEGILLFDEGDRRIQDYFIQSAQPKSEDFRMLLGCLYPDDQGAWPTLTELKVRAGLHPTRVTVVLAELVEQGIIEKCLEKSRQVYRIVTQVKDPALSRYENQQIVRKRELEAMLRYERGEVPCLMQSLRAALGDEEAAACGRCSKCRPEQYSILPPGKEATLEWIGQRDIPIPASAFPRMSAGFAILDSEQRTPLFVSFMRKRAAGKGGEVTARLMPELEALLLKKLDVLKKIYSFQAIIPITSRTWVQREETTRLIAKNLGIPAYEDLLFWKEVPASRQGELLNNDQRRENVRGKLGISCAMPLSEGAVLLLDDYTGSGATLKEAVRSLRKEENFGGEIVPLTIARVRWRLGAKGMV
jgi:ATP-dependent DNA helicase RecQ